MTTSPRSGRLPNSRPFHCGILTVQLSTGWRSTSPRKIAIGSGTVGDTNDQP